MTQPATLSTARLDMSLDLYHIALICETAVTLKIPHQMGFTVEFPPQPGDAGGKVAFKKMDDVIQLALGIFMGIGRESETLVHEIPRKVLAVVEENYFQFIGTYSSSLNQTIVGLATNSLGRLSDKRTTSAEVSKRFAALTAATGKPLAFPDQKFLGDCIVHMHMAKETFNALALFFKTAEWTGQMGKELKAQKIIVKASAQALWRNSAIDHAIKTMQGDLFFGCVMGENLSEFLVSGAILLDGHILELKNTLSKEDKKAFYAMLNKLMDKTCWNPKEPHTKEAFAYFAATGVHHPALAPSARQATFLLKIIANSHYRHQQLNAALADNPQTYTLNQNMMLAFAPQYAIFVKSRQQQLQEAERLLKEPAEILLRRPFSHPTEQPPAFNLTYEEFRTDFSKMALQYRKGLDRLSEVGMTPELVKAHGLQWPTAKEFETPLPAWDALSSQPFVDDAYVASSLSAPLKATSPEEIMVDELVSNLVRLQSRRTRRRREPAIPDGKQEQ